jgi:hypothetical protein
MAETITCPDCHGDLPGGSRFCLHCGAALARSETAEMYTQRPSPDTAEFLASQNVHPRASIHESHRRPLGAPPPDFLGVLSVVTLLLALILLIAGSWIGAIVALGASIGLIILFVPAARHDPHSPGARVTRHSVRKRYERRAPYG